MPFGIFFKKDKKPKHSGVLPLSDKEKKSLFGLKVVQAQQNPEPIYDLSGCSASFLPDDTFTFCRLLGKTTLDIKRNNLTSLESGGNLHDLQDLHVLDASDNKIDKLPVSISALQNLKVLILSGNHLKFLPDSFGYLNSLEELNLSQNKLSKVPLSICALPRLRVLDLTLNNICKFPYELCNLQKTLEVFTYDKDKINNLLQSDYENAQLLLKDLCNEANVDYTGLECPSEKFNISKPNISVDSNQLDMDEIMISYLRKKNDQLKAQASEEEKCRALEQEQMELVLKNSSNNKKELLKTLIDSPSEMLDFEDEKQRKLQTHIDLEELFRSEQSEQLDLYLSNTTNKEYLLQDLTSHDDALQKEFKSIVLGKDKEKARLLKDLSSAEEETNLALEELLNSQPLLKSEEFIKLVQDQDEEIQKLIDGHNEIATELRHSDVIKAMQESMKKDAYAYAEKEKTDEQQKSWVCALVNEGEVEASHLKNLLSEKLADQETFLADLLEEEKYQERAFRVLLADMDIKRNDVIRQIALIEFELLRLSCLELRKKMCGVQYGSSTMINQRKTLVELLQSLFRDKENRDKELDSWVNHLAHRKCEDSEDFWLMQYQALMNLKPDSLADVENNLDAKVTTILTMANALHLMPIFVKHEISYKMLLHMSEEDFVQMDVGSATYHSLQRALHNYLASTKLSTNEPSAPELDEDDVGASCMEEASDEATAPPLEPSFLETECVVCLNAECKVLFIPCGHICVCAQCCTNIEMCPICRSSVSNKFSISNY